MSPPLAVVATDLYSGEKVVIDKGLVAPAVKASCAIPGIFKPVKWGGTLLVDGGVTERVPVATARKMGADFVIAVDVGVYPNKQKINHFLDVIIQSIDIMSKELNHHRIQSADFIISPKLENVAASQFHLAPQIIAIGEEAAEQELENLQSQLGRSELLA